jgi:hypothetical protein
MKYRLYIDEVGNPDTGVSLRNPNHRYLSLTGVIFGLEYVKDYISPTLEELKSEYFGHHPDTPVILHRKELVNRKYPFHVLEDSKVEKSFNNHLLGLIKSFDYMALTVVIDKWEHVQRYQEWHRHPYHYCLMVLMERYARWLERRGAVGDVMAEARGKKEDKRLSREFAHIWEYGTLYVRPDRLQARLTSRQLKVEPKTSNVAGLQFADLLAHPSYKAVLCHHEHERLPDNFGGRIATILEDAKYDRSPYGQVDGWGRKWLP